jgi:tetratricopeptide (TPR) repeat protein
MDLDHSFLFIQGPPGTGKTYTAAQAIVALLRAGKRAGVSSNSHKAINKLLLEVEKHAKTSGFRFSGVKKANRDNPESELTSTNITTVFNSDEVSPQHQLVGGTVFHFSRDDQRGRYDYLFVDEAGQVSLGNLVAAAGAGVNIVLVGDQMQLPQPVQGVHPGETGLSSLEYLLEDRTTVPDDRGIFLNETRRLHPALCAFISEAIYDKRLEAHPITAKRHLVLSPGASAALRPAGLSFVSLAHNGCTQSSRTEVEVIARLVAELQTHKIVRNGSEAPMTLEDILVVAPYNLQVNLLKQHLPTGVQVGTVDKFQGQEAAVVIVSMTTSKGAEAPRGTAFLFNHNRFNVAISRAQCLAIVVHGTELLEGAWTKIEDLRRLNLFAHAEAAALEQRKGAVMKALSETPGQAAAKPDEAARAFDRITIRYLDDRNVFTYTLFEKLDDPAPGMLSVTSPLGSQLVGLCEGDETSIEVDGQVRPVFLGRIERLGRSVIEAAANRRKIAARAKTFLERAIIYQRNGQYDRAIADYDEAIRLDPPNVSALFNRGTLYYKQGEYDRALSDFDEVLRRDPENGLAHYYRADLYFLKGEYDLAVEDYDESMPDGTEDEDYDEAIWADREVDALRFYRRGFAYSHKGRYEWAIDDYNEAIRLDPQKAVFFVARADARLAKDDFDGALADYDEAIRLNPKDAEAIYKRGKVCLRRGEAAEEIRSPPQAKL